MESIGSWPPITSSSERGVGHGRGERPDLVEARREGDEPVAGHAPVGRLHADHAAQGGGLADRAAGVGAESRARRSRRRPRRRCRPTTRPALGWGRAGCGWARTPSSRSTSPWRTRRGWSCRPGWRRPRRAARRPWRCTAGASPRGSATSTSSGCRGCRGCPSGRRARRPADPGPRPRRPGDRSRRRPLGPRRPATRLKAWSSPSRSAMRARCSSTTSTRRSVARPGPPRRSRGAVTAPHPGSAGPRKRPSSAAGAAASTSSRSRHGPHVRRPAARCSAVGLRHGLDIVEVERSMSCAWSSMAAS